jgi:hypothetical protein
MCSTVAEHLPSMFKFNPLAVGMKGGGRELGSPNHSADWDMRVPWAQELKATPRQNSDTYLKKKERKKFLSWIFYLLK